MNDARNGSFAIPAIGNDDDLSASFSDFVGAAEKRDAESEFEDLLSGGNAPSKPAGASSSPSGGSVAPAGSGAGGAVSATKPPASQSSGAADLEAFGGLVDGLDEISKTLEIVVPIGATSPKEADTVTGGFVRSTASQSSGAADLEALIQDPGGQLDGVSVRLDPDQAGAPLGMVKVTLPDGTPHIIGQRLLSQGLSAAGDVVRGIGEAPVQAFGGLVDGFNEISKTLESVVPLGGFQITDPATGEFDPKYLGSSSFKEQFTKTEQTLFDAISPKEADTVTGGFVRSTAQFLSAFVPVAAVLSGAGAGALTTAIVAGAIADMVAFDPHEARLSTFLNTFPALDALVPDYLADNDPANEGEWEGRFKNAIEGAGLGVAAEALTRAFKYYKVARQQKKAAKVAGTPTADLQAAAGRDAIRDTAQQDLIAPVPQEALAPLGDPAGDLVINVPPGTDPADFVRFEAARRDTTKALADQLEFLRGALEEATKDTSEFGKSKTANIRARMTRLEKVAAKHFTPENVDKVTRAIGNMADASGRVDRQAAVDVINAAAKAIKAETGADPVDELLKLIRKGAGADPRNKMQKRPALDILKQAGGVDPQSTLAGDLRELGVTNKTAPGLYRKNGIGAADNFVASEHPIFKHLAGDSVYVQPSDFYDAVQAEMAGDPLRSREEQAVLEIYDAASETSEGMQRALEALGVDFDTMDNAAIKRRMAEVDAEQARFASLDEIPDGEAKQLGMNEADIPYVPDGKGGTEKPVGKVFINHARINTSDDIKTLIQQMADADEAAIKAKTRGTVSNAQTLKEAKQNYQDLSDLIGRAPGPMSAAEAVAARKILTASGEQVAALAKKASADGATQADIFNLQKAMSVHYAIQSEVIAARTETARALQSWSIPAGSDKMRADAISALIERNGGAGDLQKLAKAISALSDNPTGMNVAIRESLSGNLKAAAYQVWINGLLSSPKTHAVNVTSNSLTALWAIPERYLAAGVSKVFYSGEVDAGEVGSMAYGMVKGFRDGVRLVAYGNNAADIGDLSDVFDLFSKVEGDHNVFTGAAFGVDDASAMGKGIYYMGKAINVPGKALQAEDKFFKSVGYRMQLHALAYRKALGEGLEGDAMAQRINDILQDPPKDLVADAIDFASVQTFTNNLGPTGQAIQGVIRKIPGGRVVVPFIRTPTNIMKYAFLRTPLAFAAASVRADIRAGGARAAQAHARVAMGSMLMATIADLASEGTLVGAGPADPELRKVWLGTGKKPYSVKIGDRWYSYSRLDPVGMLVGMSADMADIMAHIDEEEGGKLAMAAAFAFTNNLASKTWTQGAFDFIAAVDPSNPTSDPGKYLANLSGTIMPYSSFVRNANAARDPLLRETRTSAADPLAVEHFSGLPDPIAEYMVELINEQRKNIPGLSETLPPRRDLWGEPITRESGIGWAHDLISPIASSVDNPDKVNETILKNRVPVSSPPRTIQNVKLTAEEYSQFVEMAGKPAKAYLDKFVSSPGFDRMSDGPDGMKSELIRDVINNFRNQARTRMVAENEGLRRRVLDAAIKNQSLKLGK